MTSSRLLRQTAAVFLDDTKGAAGVELAVLAPMLAMVLVCTVDIGMGIYRKMQVQNAAQAGAAYAARNGFNASAIANAVVTAAPTFAISAAPAPRQFCGCASESEVAPAACDSACAAGAAAGSYAEVSAQGVYTPLLPYPLFETSFTFTAKSTVRLQ